MIRCFNGVLGISRQPLGGGVWIFLIREAYDREIVQGDDPQVLSFYSVIPSRDSDWERHVVRTPCHKKHSLSKEPWGSTKNNIYFLTLIVRKRDYNNYFRVLNWLIVLQIFIYNYYYYIEDEYRRNSAERNKKDLASKRFIIDYIFTLHWTSNIILHYITIQHNIQLNRSWKRQTWYLISLNDVCKRW